MGRTDWKLRKSLSVVKIGIRRRVETAQSKKSVFDPWMPFLRAVLKYSEANS